MPVFIVEAQCDAVVLRLFESDDSLHIRFGWSAHSYGPAKPSDVLLRKVRFRDYIMEGHLCYSVQLFDTSPTCTLHVDGEGSNRDAYISSQVRAFFKGAGLGIREANDIFA